MELLRQIGHDELEVVKESLNRGYLIPHEFIRKMYNEIERLHDIERHLAPVATANEQGVFVLSHYVDDREPKQRAKFDACMAHTRMKHELQFERMDNRMCTGCNDPAHTMYVRREKATGKIAGRCMREDCENSRCLQELKS